MGTKRTPQIISKAKKLRAAGRSYAEIAEELSKEGKSISKASVVAWLRGPSAPTASVKAARPAPAEAVQPPAAASPEPSEAREAHEDLTPDELRGVLANVIRSASRAAAAAEAAGDHAEAKNQRKILGLFTNQLRQIHSKQDEDTETVRVKAADMAAAADRAMVGLRQLAERVSAERASWPKCSACGQPHGEFAPGDKSPLRLMFERVVKS